MTSPTCCRCGTPLQVPQTGRPPIYCGNGCRRAAEHEIRRLVRHLERYEHDAADSRLRIAAIRARYPDERPDFVEGQVREPQAQLDALQAEIARAEERMTALLDEEDR